MARGGIDRPLLQRMRERRVMVERCRLADARARVEDQIGFGWVEIAARRIVAQRPGGPFKILPRADAEGEFEKEAKGGLIERRGRDRAAGNCAVSRWSISGISIWRLPSKLR